MAIDSTNLDAWANGHRTVTKGGPERERFADPDASWGHRSAISTRVGQHVDYVSSLTTIHEFLTHWAHDLPASSGDE